MLYIINYVCKFAAKLNVYMFNLNYIVMKEFAFLDEVVLGESEMLEIHGGASDTVTCGSNCGHNCGSNCGNDCGNNCSGGTLQPTLPTE